ncbi:50S ribosomal protein L23 [Candidatus Kaiserbacteria bacterium]|nr:50S ribosomal protein L23 [Candidatus Kaiserbacteria bacterium]
MALFGNKKIKKKTPASPRLRRARQAKLAAGVAHDIIRAPWFSEKALIATEKAHIAGAIKDIYKVEPRKIRIVNLPAKRKAMRTKRGVGVRAARRKAYVYLNKGDSIQFA